MSTPAKRRIEYWVVGLIGLILVITAIVFFFFNWIVSIILLCIAFGIHVIYYYFFMIRAKVKSWGLTPTAEPCLIIGGLIVAAIIIISTVNVIL
ncbi:MAG: hypothetical protein ACFE8N_11210 [Promethearchaeota archaeon]